MSPEALACTFFEIVKGGNVMEIQSFLGSLVFKLLAKHNMDASKLVDDRYKHTGLFYATLIKDSQK
jgi:hypothetical protein